MDLHLATEQVVFVSDVVGNCAHNTVLFPPISVLSMHFFWNETVYSGSVWAARDDRQQLASASHSALWLGEFVQSQQYCTMAGVADYMGNIRL